MSHYRIDSPNHRSLAVLVESTVAPLLRDHPAPICLELDVPVNLPVPADTSLTGLLLESLTRSAIREMPTGGDLNVTACDVDGRVELEFADTGSRVTARVQTRPLVAAKLGATLRWDNCPQGGAAVTILFPPAKANELPIRGQIRRAA